MYYNVQVVNGSLRICEIVPVQELFGRTQLEAILKQRELERSVAHHHADTHSDYR